MSKPYLLILFFSLSIVGKLHAQAPSISGFSPSSGPVGTVVTINGSNFNATAANNVVYFGGAKATVTSATATTITAIVPEGSTFEPISVTSNSATAYSQSPFIATFKDGNTVFAPTAFAPPVSLGLGKSLCYDTRKVVLADFDNDGKTDIAVNDPTGNAIYVLKNVRNGSGPLFNSVPTLTLTTGNTPLQLVDADIDGDGLIDLVAINRVSNTISIFKNTSTGGVLSFAPKVDLSTVATPVDLAVGDLDGDGKPDIAIASLASNTVSVYLNISDGTGIKFAPKVDYSSYQPGSVAIEDMNGDGKADLLYTNPANSELDIRKNNSSIGTLAFGPAVYFTQNFYMNKITLADVDGDGKPDLLIPGTSGLEIVANTTPALGNFSFATPKYTRLYLISADLADRALVRAGTTVSERGISVSAGDLDGDGKPDIIVTYSVSPPYTEFSVLKNLSTPGNIKLDVNEEFNSNVPESVAIADLDGDGKPDITLGTREIGVVDFVKNRVTEPVLTGYKTTNGTNVTITGTNLLQTSAVTINGTPVSSFTITSETSITANVAVNTTGAIVATTPYGTASFPGFTNVAPPGIQSFSPTSGPVGSVVTIMGSNFNPTPANNLVLFGTSKATVTAATANSLTVTVPYGSTFKPITVTSNNQTAYSTLSFTTTFAGGPAKFTSTSFAPKTDLNPGYTFPKGIAQVDFDGDGYLDIAFASNYSTTTSTVYIYRNSGNKQTPFSTQQTLITSGKPLDIVSGDFDNDGKPDLLIANTEASTFSIFKNTSSPGSVSFAARMDFAGYDRLSNLFVGDIDGDGKPDIVSVSATIYGRFSVYRNTSGNGIISFAHKVDYITSNISAMDIVMNDFDGDGKIDVIVSSGSNIDIFRNISINGAIAFATRTSIPSGGTSVGIASGDLDNDGKPDLVAVTAANAVSAFRNTSTAGNITFAAPVSSYLNTQSSAFDVTINDLDGDGKPDIAVTNSGNATLSVIKNTTIGSTLAFDSRIDYTTGTTPQTITAVDFNNDSKPDLAVANFGTGGVSLLLSTVTEPALTGYQFITGDANNNVKFTGANLLGVTSLTIAGTAVTSFTVVSDTVITALVAKNAKGTVVATNIYGTGSLLNFVYYSVPVINSYTTSPSGTDTKVIVKGLYLTGATAVTFDGVAAKSYTVNSDLQITAITGSSTFQNISVTTPGGTYVYTNAQVPVISGLNVTTGGTGTVVTITGTYFIGATSVSFGGVAASSFNVVSPTSITAVVGNGATGNVTVTNPAGTATFSGFTYTATPSIIAGAAVGTISACAGTPSSSPNIQQFTVSGSNLSAGITATAPTNFEISITASSGYGSSIVIPQSGGTANTTIVYVRSAASASGNASGNIVLTSTGATTQNVAVSATINALPVINSPSNQTVANGSNTVVNFSGTTGNTINWVNNNSAIGLTASGTGNISFTAVNNSITPVTATIVATPVSSTGCSGLPVTFTITVQPSAPSITTSGNLGALVTDYGAASPSTSFTVSGSNLTTGILVTPPQGFEVSTDNINFSKTVTVGTSGTIASTTVYLRLAASNPVGSYSGNVVLSGTGVANVNVAIANSEVSLPATTFKLTITSATCKGSANGSVNIIANQSISYIATITGNGLNKRYAFTNSTNIDSLSAGSYNVCISVQGTNNYKQCYDVVITEPVDLSVYSIVNDANNTINLSLAGADQYNIVLNGALYTTTDNSITLPLKEGNNELSVSTDKLCQGIVQKVVSFSGKITPYPVPFQNSLSLNLGNSTINNVSVELHNVSDGKVVYTQKYVNQSGVLQLDLTGLKDGVYALHLSMDNNEKIFKIIKK